MVPVLELCHAIGRKTVLALNCFDSLKPLVWKVSKAAGAGNSHVALGFSCMLTQSRDLGTGLWETVVLSQLWSALGVPCPLL